MSSPRKRSCAVRRLRTCESGYSGCCSEGVERQDGSARNRANVEKERRTLSMRFVLLSPSNCHLKRSSSGWTSGASARRGLGLVEARTPVLGGPGIGLLA